MSNILKDIFKGAVMGLLLWGLFDIATGRDDWLSSAAALTLILVPFVTLIYLTRPTRRSLALPGRWFAVLAAVDQALRLNRPPQPLLAAAEEFESFGVRCQLYVVRRRIDAGDSIVTAINQGATDLPARSAGLLVAAERKGQLPKVIERLLAETKPVEVSGAMAIVRFYPALVAMLIVFVGGMLARFVGPKFVQIFHDFRVPSPVVLHTLIAITDAVADPIVVIGLLILWGAGAVLSRFGITPGEYLFVGNRGLADACGLIADDLDARLPMPTAVSDAAELRVGRRLQNKLRSWAAMMQAGGSVVESARAAKMPRLLLGLATMPNADDSAAAFRFLSNYYLDRHRRRGAIVRRIGLPIVVFSLAAVVAFLGLSVFVPMTTLIDLAGHFPGSL